MIEGTFTKEDKEKVIEYLNRVAKHAKFSDINTTDLISYYKLLAHMQTQILPKIEANILEVIDIVEPKENEEEVKE